MASIHPSTRLWVALGLGLAVVLLFVACFVVLSSAAPTSTGDQCSKPLSQRTGGWICPE